MQDGCVRKGRKVSGDAQGLHLKPMDLLIKRQHPALQTPRCKAETQGENLMQNNPVAWFEIYVDDMARARKFYETVLNVSLERLSDPNDSSVEMHAFPADMEQYGATGALVKMGGFAAGGNSTLIYFSCDDCAIEQARVESAGGRIQESKKAIGEYGFISLAIDTEGNMFGLHSLK